jgi:hypothetical protein
VTTEDLEIDNIHDAIKKGALAEAQPVAERGKFLADPRANLRQPNFLQGINGIIEVRVTVVRSLWFAAGCTARSARAVRCKLPVHNEDH